MDREGSNAGETSSHHNPRLSRLLQTSPSHSTSPASSIRSSSAASIFERDIEPGHPIHSGFLGSREATDLSTAPALTEAVEAFVGSNSNDSIGVQVPSNNDWGTSSFNSTVFTSPSQSLILAPPSPPTNDSNAHSIHAAASTAAAANNLSASPPHSPPPPQPLHQPQTPSPLNPLAGHSPRHTSTSPNLIESPGACHRISLLSYGDVITERPTSAVPLQTALNQSPPQSQLLNEGAESVASPAANYVEERNREAERAALSKGLEARLEALSFPEQVQQPQHSPHSTHSPPIRPASRNISPIPPVAVDLSPSASAQLPTHAQVPAEERYIEEKETVTERGAERLSHRIQSLAV